MTEDKLINNIVDKWNSKNRCNGTIKLPNPINAIKPIYIILPKVFNKSPTTNVLIIVDNFTDKDVIIDYLTNQHNTYDVVYKTLLKNGKIEVLTISWINDNIDKYNPNLLIVYKPTYFDFIHDVMIKKSKFNLVIVDDSVSNDTYNDFCNFCPSIYNVRRGDVDTIRTNSPVEEIIVPISIDETSEEFRLLTYYNNNIRIALNIFKDFNGIKCAMSGNNSNNTSSLAYCEQLAISNGWNERLDMSIDYNRQIDELYSPNAIKNRADETYNIIRKRARLVANYSKKVNAVIDIVNENKGKKIIIINKFADFADDITNNLNIGKKESCISYHNQLESIPAIDEKGNPIYYKSGNRKGERKLMGVKSRKNLAQKMFNMGKINVLSTNALPDEELNIDVDVVIITSPLCEPLNTYIYRLSKVTFNKPIILYSIYCKDTIESRVINNRTSKENHNITIKNDNNEDDNENYCAYTIVD